MELVAREMLLVGGPEGGRLPGPRPPVRGEVELRLTLVVQDEESAGLEATQLLHEPDDHLLVLGVPTAGGAERVHDQHPVRVLAEPALDVAADLHEGVPLEPEVAEAGGTSGWPSPAATWWARPSCVRSSSSKSRYATGC